MTTPGMSGADAQGENGRSEATLTIEQLAAETGMTVRNIRSHQARGLLASPEVRMRVGYYGREHVAQLRLIRELQDEGFNLSGIKRLLDDAGGTAERMLRFKRTLTAPLHNEQPETLTVEDLTERFGAGSDAADALGKAIRLGVLASIGDGVYEAPSPALLAVADELVRRGISLGGALEVLESLEKHCESISRSFVRLLLREVWKPFQVAGMPDDRWPEIEEAIERLRPIASDAVLAIFQQSMSREVEGAFGEITKRLSQSRR